MRSPGKVLTFSDSVTSVRLWLWADWVFSQAGGGLELKQLPADVAGGLADGHRARGV
jgi:hypothetical protein